jgi:hypothetical protein
MEVLWTSRSPANGNSRRELRCTEVPSEIGSQGFMRVVNHDSAGANFSMGGFPIGT